MIVVFGSVNVDFVTRVPHAPKPGETVLGPDYTVYPGGKGANQALAAARSGAAVTFVGAVGTDPFAEIGLALLAEAGVDLTHVACFPVSTGAAFIAVDHAGENAIIVASGANHAVTLEGLEKLVFAEQDILLLQGELPAAETLAAARWAKSRGGRVILNMAPATSASRALIESVDFLIVNEDEAKAIARLLALESTDPDAIAEAIDRSLGVNCIVTLGSRGAVGWYGGVRREVPASPVNVIDTTGAGDTFCGAFAAALSRGYGFGGALMHGVVAGGLACTKSGAQPAVPLLADIRSVLGDQFC